MRGWRLAPLLALLAAALAYGDEPLSVAVASNFQQTARALGERFEQGTGLPVRFSAGSTGRLYAQIVNGAPFDVFLAADTARPRLLEERGLGLAGTRRTYATGTLLLWSRDARLAQRDCRAGLEELDGAKLAIANPDIAPYGRAAREFLEAAGLWKSVEANLVLGENIAQAMQFAATGNARFGLVAESQLRNSSLPAASCTWPVPETSHQPIRQQAIVIAGTGNETVAVQFLDFLGSEEGRSIIERDGYRVQDAQP